MDSGTVGVLVGEQVSFMGLPAIIVVCRKDTVVLWIVIVDVVANPAALVVVYGSNHQSFTPIIPVPAGSVAVLQDYELVVIAGAQAIRGVNAGLGIRSRAYQVQVIRALVCNLFKVQPSQRILLKCGISYRQVSHVVVTAVIHEAPVSHGGILLIVFVCFVAIVVIRIVEIRQAKRM